MATEFDINKATAEYWKSMTLESFSKIKEVGGDVLNKYLKTRRQCFGKYMTASSKKFSRVKTILYRDKWVPIRSFYQPLTLECGTTVCDTITADSLLKASRCCLVTGTAGIGKSTLLKHLHTATLTADSHIPVFIELREMDSTAVSLRDLIFSTMRGIGLKMEWPHLSAWFEKGGFIFFLDGFDEIAYDKQADCARQIFELSESFGEDYFIVTSRPDPSFAGWHAFAEFRIRPLTQPQAVQLIAKIQYDPQIKKKFIDELQSGLFIRHHDFLSIPLLLTIMLLTYGENANVPAKIYLFYSQVFDALFNKHDATKAVYKRKRFTKLAIDDFKKVLSAFSMISRARQKLTFMLVEVMEYLGEAKRIVTVEFEETDYLQDLLKSVCVLSHDGQYYSFTHRTFQEYFAACYVAKVGGTSQGKLISALTWGDKVFELLLDMEPDLLEQKAFLPWLTKIAGEFPVSVGNEIDTIYRFLAFCYDRLAFSNGGECMVGEFNTNYERVVTLRKRYPSLVPERGDGKQPIPMKSVVNLKEFSLPSDGRPRYMSDQLYPYAIIPGDVKSTNETKEEILRAASGMLPVRTLSDLGNLFQHLKTKHARTESSIEEILGLG